MYNEIMVSDLFHAFLMICTIGLTFLFPKTWLAEYDVQISAILFIFLYIGKRILTPKGQTGRVLESVIFTFIIVSIINTTGGVTSPFFFLLYFLLFALSLLLEPVISIISTISLIVFFLLTLQSDTSLESMLPVFSLAFLAPFAQFMGQQYITGLKEKQRSALLNDKLISQQEQTYLFMSLIMKNHIANIKDAVENYTGDHELDKIKKTARRMESLLMKYENNMDDPSKKM
ncbi:MAG: hypothetical protein RI947_1017 [Candidatus Parcubacteria bacterium]|jgi:signal transduction histidine kinase